MTVSLSPGEYVEQISSISLILQVSITNLSQFFVDLSAHVTLVELLQCVSENPLPVFQKLLLQDLPTELHCQIMEVAGQHAARQLGSTCKYFHSISLSYIYQVCVLSIENRKLLICIRSHAPLTCLFNYQTSRYGVRTPPSLN